MDIEERIGKHDAFAMIVGRKPHQGKYAGDVPNFEIKPAEIDKTYLIVKKMQRCYHKDPTYPIAQYYAQSFSQVEKAYLSQDLNAFQQAVRDLMIDIDSE